MSKRTTLSTVTPLPDSLSRDFILSILHNHDQMITLNPLVIAHTPIKPPATATAEEAACAWYSLTDRISYLPNGLLSGNVTYTACLHELPEGLQTRVYAPAGTTIKGKWSVGGSQKGEKVAPRELGIGLEKSPVQGLYLREDAEIRCNMLLMPTVKRNLKKSHKKLVETMIEMAREKQLEGASTAVAPEPVETIMEEEDEHTTEGDAEQAKWPLAGTNVNMAGPASRNSLNSSFKPTTINSNPTTAVAATTPVETSQAARAPLKIFPPGPKRTRHTSLLPPPLLIQTRPIDIANRFNNGLSESPISYSRSPPSPTLSRSYDMPYRNFSRPTSQHRLQPMSASPNSAVNRTDSKRGRQPRAAPSCGASAQQRAVSSGHPAPQSSIFARHEHTGDHDHGHVRCQSTDAAGVPKDSACGNDCAVASTRQSKHKASDSGIALEDDDAGEHSFVMPASIPHDEWDQWDCVAMEFHDEEPENEVITYTMPLPDEHECLRSGWNGPYVRGTGPQYSGNEVHPALRVDGSGFSGKLPNQHLVAPPRQLVYLPPPHAPPTPPQRANTMDIAYPFPPLPAPPTSSTAATANARGQASARSMAGHPHSTAPPSKMTFPAPPTTGPSSSSPAAGTAKAAGDLPVPRRARARTVDQKPPQFPFSAAQSQNKKAASHQQAQHARSKSVAVDGRRLHCHRRHASSGDCQIHMQSGGETSAAPLMSDALP